MKNKIKKALKILVIFSFTALLSACVAGGGFGVSNSGISLGVGTGINF